MFRLIENLVPPTAIAELRAIAATANFVDGRISNPHNKAKQNLQLHDPNTGKRVTEILAEALFANEDFRNFAQPKIIAPPILTSYRQSMRYGAHTDAAFMQVGQRMLRSDVSCTIFLSDPASYEGGALRVLLGTSSVEIKPEAGSAILYPSTTLHEVTPVTSGSRLVGLTFIESRIADPVQRELLYELGEVVALEGLNMAPENHLRLYRVRENLLRAWGDHD